MKATSLTDWITAVATVAIVVLAILLHEDYKQHIDAIERTALENRTLEKLEDLNRDIADIVERKIALDSDYKPQGINGHFSFEYINARKDVEGLVFRLLNEYEALCLGGDKGLWSNELISLLRGDALRRTIHQYKKYIDEYREKYERNSAWMQCENWIAKHSES